MLLQGSQVNIGLQDCMKLQDCDFHYKLVRIVFLQPECAHFTAAARQADGLWAYLDSAACVQRVSLQQLQQQRGDQVVGVLLISMQQLEDDGRMLLADYLMDNQHQFEPASGQHR